MTTPSATPAPASARTPAAPATAAPHGVVEDVFALLIGTFVVSFGLFLLTSSSAVTGGTAGLALLLGYALPLPFGAIYLLVNLPFLVLSLVKKGWVFTLRTVASIVLVAGFAAVHPLAFGTIAVPPVYGVLAGDVLVGIGVLILFRHRASLGGFTILALIAQEQLRWRAGYVLMVLDACVVLAGLLVVPWGNVLLSALGVVLLNLVLAFNHRPGRYLGM